MHKDPNLRKRDALVIPGGLLALACAIGALYVLFLRGDDGTCEDAGLMVLAGACRSALLVLAIPLILGLAMVGTGALAYRNKATCRRGHGSGAHFGLALLIAMVVLPAIGAFAAPSLVGEDAVVTRGEVDYPVTTILEAMAGIGFLALVPYVLLYVARNQANSCCTEKGCFDPCFCDEAEAPAEETTPPTAAEPAAAMEAAPQPPPAEAVAEPAPQWTEPAPAAESWEVVPDEPAPPEPAPAPEPVVAAAPEPALAPEAPPAPMADAAVPADVKAKWAQEDEEAKRELAGSDRRARAAAAAAKAKATKSKPAAKPKKAASKSKK